MQTSTTTTRAATLAPDPGEQGPVGQPAATTDDGGATPFTYTTTDAEGNTIQVVATFTPTFPATTPFTPSHTGTILAYTDWLKVAGTQTRAFSGSGATVNAALSIGQRAGAMAMTIAAGVLSGALLIL